VPIVEIHAHAGYLLDQFLSPDINKRTDEYGGDMSGRFKIVKDIREAITKRVGNAVAVTIRISVDHKVPGFRTLEEGLQLCDLIEATGYDGIHVDAGRYESTPWIFPPAYLGPAPMKNLAAAVKKRVKIPVIIVGNFSRASDAELAIADGSADFIALGRTSLADPEWAKKAREGRDEDIRPCIACNDMCIGRLFLGKGVTCSVNPECARETVFTVRKADEPKRITVVGGGPAGMEAAIVASKRGHRVTLIEKKDELGGQMNLADKEAFKYAVADFNKYMKTQIEKSDVDVLTGTAASVEIIEGTKPDVVIAATGADVFVPPIPGFDDERVMTVRGLHERELAGDERFVVVGGGLVGSETALSLAMQGHNVTIVEMLGDIAKDLAMISRITLLEKIAEAGIEVLTNTKCKEITGDELVCEDGDGAEVRLSFDLVVAATGTRKESALAEEIRQTFMNAHVIGDCDSIGKIGEAIHRGYIVGTSI
jgi:NADPH-dependent 2,4-dienoyl-CoA reductase/sulfur reductase-like enzyme